MHLGKPNTGPEHYQADEKIVADANKYHAQVTASHAQLGGASSAAAIQQLLERMEQDLTRTMTERMEAMMQQLATKVDTLEAKVNRIAEQVTRVEQIMSAGVSHCFPSMSVHEYQNRYTTKALTAGLPATSGLWRITMERTR